MTGPTSAPGPSAPPPGLSSRQGMSHGTRLALIIGAAVIVVTAVAVAAIAIVSGSSTTKRVTTGRSAVTTPVKPTKPPRPGTTVPGTTPNTATATLSAADTAFLSGLRSSGGTYRASPLALVSLGNATCGHLAGGANFVDTWYYTYQNAPSVTNGSLGAIESETLLVQAAQHLCNTPANARNLSTFQTDVSNYDGDLHQYDVSTTSQQEIAGQEASMTCSELDNGQTAGEVFHGLISFILGPAAGVISQKQAGEVSTLAIRSLCGSHFTAWAAYLQAHYGS
jgi:hypothetical protein